MDEQEANELVAQLEEDLDEICRIGNRFMHLSMYDVADKLMDATLLILQKYPDFNPNNRHVKGMQALQQTMKDKAKEQSKNKH